MRCLIIIAFAFGGLGASPALGQQGSPNQQVIGLSNSDNNGLYDQQYRYYLQQVGKGNKAIYQKRSNVRFVRFEKVEDSRKKSIGEDAAVLNHMISKELPLKNFRSALGVSYTHAYGNNEIFYDDRGLTFVYHVPVQLVPGDESESDVENDKPKSDWQKAKEELSGSTLRQVMVTSNLVASSSQNQFSQEYVDRITVQIRSALNNAGNIRDLSEEDMITVFVYGKTDDPTMRSVMAWRVKWKNLGPDNSGLESALEETTYVEKTNLGAFSYYSVDGTGGSSR